MNIWANTVITNKGLALLAKLTQGNTLDLVDAIVGAGYVTPGTLQKQVEVLNPKQTLKFRPVSYPEDGVCELTMVLTNDELDTGYEATQIGVFATDPDEGRILFFIAQSVQSDKGTTIPSREAMPGYSAEWAFKLKYGQADSVSVTVDPSNTVSRAEMEDYINALHLELEALSNRINAALDSEDVDLDQLSEIVAYIKSNKTLIDAITTNKVSYTDIVNNLTTNVANKPLSAAQGVALKKLIDDLNTAMPDAYTHPSSHPASMITGLATVATSGSYNDLKNKPTIPNAYTHPAYTAKASGLYKITVDATGHVSAATAVAKEDITALGIPGTDNNTRSARKVVGTSASGWTAKDCNYLCDGTDDQVEINEALASLPSTGGEVILLDGTYNLSAKIDVSKSYSTLRGSGQATKLVRAFNGDKLLYLSGGHCTIEDLNIDGKKSTYTSTSNAGIYFLTGNNILKGLIVRNNAGTGISVGSEHNKVIGCTVTDSKSGIFVDHDHCIISGNIIHSNSEKGIDVSGNHNVIEGNVSRLNGSSNLYMYGSTYNTVCNNDLSVVSGDSVTPKAIYLTGTSNANNIVVNNNVGDGAISVATGTNNIVGSPVTREEWQANLLATASVE